MFDYDAPPNISLWGFSINKGGGKGLGWILRYLSSAQSKIRDVQRYLSSPQSKIREVRRGEQTFVLK